MSILDSIYRFMTQAPEARQLSPNQAWARGVTWNPLSGAGISVTAEMAMQAAVGACVRLLADDISSLPVDVIRKVGGVSQPSNRPAWIEYPTGRRWDTFQAHISDVVVSLLTDGNVFTECAPDTFSPRYFSVKDPERWDVTLEGSTVVYTDGITKLDDERMMHIPWVRMPGKLRGLSVLSASRDSAALELAAREWANAFFRNGATVGTIIKHPGRPSNEEVDLMRESFNAAHQGATKAFRLGIVTGGADIAQGGNISPNEAALEPLWKHVLEEAARLYHIPPHLLGSQDPGGSSFASVEQRSIEYVQHAVVPITTRLEAAYSRFLGRDRAIKFNVNALLRGDIKTRSEWYTVALQNKVMKPSEVRDKEDLPPDPSNQGYLETPNNNQPGGSAGAAQDDEETHTVTFVDASPTVRVDSLAISESAVERIAAASTDGVATGIAVLGDDLSGTFTDGITRLRDLTTETHNEAQAEIVALQERIAVLEDRVLAPVSLRVQGDTVYETRGERVTKKRIQRDPTGKVVGLVAESA